MSKHDQYQATSCALFGIDALRVDISMLVKDGPPQIQILGLSPSAVRESRERIRAALRYSGYDFPSKSLVLKIAPADLLREATFFDLPMALTVLVACELLPQDALKGRLICGELGLDGSVRSVRGGLAIAELGSHFEAREVLLPAANAPEAAALAAVPVVGLRSLAEAVLHLTGAKRLAPLPVPSSAANLLADAPDLSEVRGQETAKRALEVAAAGGHNLLFVGPPGSGKTMLARRLPGLLPPLTPVESIAVTRIHSLVAEEPPEGLLLQRPFRSPHSGTSSAGMIGGGSNPRPGEVSLAHNGVLFLDDLPEFRRDTLEALRQPLEHGFVSLVRASTYFSFPAQFSLLAAMNPCPCGHWGDPRYSCGCSPSLIQRYRGRVSGSLLERMDLHVEVPAVSLKELRSSAGESTAAVARRVAAAREVQLDRFGPQTLAPCNAEMGPEALRRFCSLDGAGRQLLDAAFEKLGLSALALDHVLKVARTIADLAGSDSIRASHLAEALQYRSL